MKKETIIKKPKSDFVLEELEKNRMMLEATRLPNDGILVKAGEYVIPDYKAKFIEGDLVPPKAKKRVNYDLQEPQKDETFIALKPGLMSSKKRESNNEEYLLVTNSLITKCREKRSVSEAIKEMISCFLGKYSEINFRKNFFHNFTKNISDIINSEKKYTENIST